MLKFRVSKYYFGLQNELHFWVNFNTHGNGKHIRHLKIHSIYILHITIQNYFFYLFLKWDHSTTENGVKIVVCKIGWKEIRSCKLSLVVCTTISSQSKILFLFCFRIIYAYLGFDSRMKILNYNRIRFFFCGKQNKSQQIMVNRITWIVQTTILQ